VKTALLVYLIGGAMSENLEKMRVAIVGAGPAGLYAARELAENGINVALFNRDIKPGGLAEYGIYPDKYRIKDGLRKQFFDILHRPEVHYFGNVPIGEKQTLSISGLKKMGFSAVLVAAGAQGTKWLGLPGEECSGVYHAKELVLAYNHLPEYAQKNFKIGHKVAIIGVGNVMTDIVRFLLTLPQVQEITTIARRGLGEIKFDHRELEHIVSHLDIADFDTEVKRVAPVLSAIGQDVQAYAEVIREAYERSTEPVVPPVWRLRFLYSPVKILCPADGQVWCLRLEENTLENIPGGTKARGTGKISELDVDTVIFAIGDSIDPEMGLPVKNSTYVVSPEPRYPQEGVSFEVDRNALPAVDLDGVFVSGWSRNASKGMVGIARRDGANAAHTILQYLQDHPTESGVQVSTLEVGLKQAGYNPIYPADLELLATAEKDRAAKLGLVEYKFDSNEEMLQAMGKV
jgi:ferredoxin/flavodoxin---NADP+ reductase